MSANTNLTNIMRKEIIEAHYREIWKTDFKVCDFSKGPVNQLPADFAILEFAPHSGRSMWTYATRCMSTAKDEKSIELHMFSSIQSQEIVEILFATAHFHHTVTKLDVGHTVYFGRPWLENSECDYGLVSVPYLDGPNLETMSSGSTRLYFYWMIPVTKAEVAFKKAHGLEALESKFESLSFDYSDPHRSSAI